MARITISFKDTEKDNRLYNYWFNIEDRSAEIKPLLQAEMERRLKNGQSHLSENNVEKVNSEVNILDF